MIIEIKVPAVGESITEVVIGRWLKPDGAMVQADQAICEIESEKAAMEIAAERAGLLRHQAAQGATVPVGAVIGTIDPEAMPMGIATGADRPAAGPTMATPAIVSAEAEKTRSTPLARKLMAESGLAAAQIRGSGPSGRITRKDVLETAGRAETGRGEERLAAGPAEATAAATAAATTAATAADRPVRREKMTTLRQTISRRLVTAKNQTAMLTTINELDMSAILKLRAEHQEAFVRRWGLKVGFMSFFTRAVCLALREVPVINAAVAENEIVFHDYCDVSISVSTPRGLVVPVIRDAGRRNIPELELEIQRLAEKARAGKLSIDEMSGGTFTITNGGVFGSLISTPLINYPQSAILGMHTIKERPVAENGQVVIRPMLYLSLSYDHRIIDGRESVTFLIRVKELLEASTPALLEL